MKGLGEATAISEALFDFVGQGISMFDTEDTIMDSVCDLIDFDGDLDIPMEDIKVSPARDAFPPSDDTFMLSKKLKDEPVPMEVDSEPLFWPSYPTAQGRRNYEDAFSPDEQVRRELAVSFRNLGLDLPVELGGRTRPVKKVIRHATRARAGGLQKYSRPDVVQGEIGSKSPREYLFIFPPHFNPNSCLTK
jgi:hypothetical protein